MPPNIVNEDARFMWRALELAEKALPLCHPNPAVGAVIVRDGRILGEGFTQKAGGNHAEIEALKDARHNGQDVRGATAYVTLEPCSHFGRTPPCADRLVREGLARVVAAMADPNPSVDGRGFAVLREAGVEVETGVLEDRARYLNRAFCRKMTTNRPWVMLKTGMSLDAKTALPDGASQWITSEASRSDARRLRASCGAILTGSGTVLADNPRMTARLQDVSSHEPLRIVLDTNMRVDPQAKVFEGGNAIWCVHEARREVKAAMEKRGVQVWELPLAKAGLDLEALMKRLSSLPLNSVMLEAGAVLSGAFLASGLVDEIVAYVAPVVLGPGRPAFDVPALERLDAAKRYVLADVRRFGDDLKLTYLSKEQEDYVYRDC